MVLCRFWCTTIGVLPLSYRGPQVKTCVRVVPVYTGTFGTYTQGRVEWGHTERTRTFHDVYCPKPLTCHNGCTHRKHAHAGHTGTGFPTFSLLHRYRSFSACPFPLAFVPDYGGSSASAGSQYGVLCWCISISQCVHQYVVNLRAWVSAPHVPLDTASSASTSPDSRTGCVGLAA